MGELVSLAAERQNRTPHLAGKASCLRCGHNWVAVAPVGTVDLECPECRAMRGIFTNMIEHEGAHYVCSCGNFHFLVSAFAGIYCPCCGVRHGFSFPEPGPKAAS